MAESKLDKYGGVIGKRWGPGELDEENFERMLSILSLKNWRNELASVRQVYQGMNWKGCGGVLKS